MLVLARCLFHRDGQGGHFWNSRFAQPIIVCGENPLPVFCAGAVLSTAVSWLVNTNQLGLGGQALINLAGWLTCFAVATIAKLVRSRLQSEARHQRSY
jgi:threonine/homoserine/homoserine lactone efflux protein